MCGYEETACETFHSVRNDGAVQRESSRGLTNSASVERDDDGAQHWFSLNNKRNDTKTTSRFRCCACCTFPLTFLFLVLLV